MFAWIAFTLGLVLFAFSFTVLVFLLFFQPMKLKYRKLLMIFTGIDHLPPENLRDAPLEKRLDPVGVGGGDNLSSRRKW